MLKLAGERAERDEDGAGGVDGAAAEPHVGHQDGLTETPNYRVAEGFPCRQTA